MLKKIMIKLFCNHEWFKLACKKTDKSLKVKEMYEYGDGIYVNSLETRVDSRVEEFKKIHDVVSVDYKWIPQTYLGKNCMNMDVWKPRECFITIYYR